MQRVLHSPMNGRTSKSCTFSSHGVTPYLVAVIGIKRHERTVYVCLLNKAVPFSVSFTEKQGAEEDTSAALSRYKHRRPD